METINSLFFSGKTSVQELVPNCEDKAYYIFSHYEFPITVNVQFFLYYVLKYVYFNL